MWKRRALLGALALGGCGIIAIGWGIQGNTFRLHGAARSFMPGLLTSVGTALLLGVLFILIQSSVREQIREVDETAQALGERVENVSQEVKATVNRLDELTAETRRLLGDVRERDAAMVHAVEEEASFESVAALLGRAIELDVVSRRGPRIAMEHGERLRFVLRFAQERVGGQTPMIWIGQESPSGASRNIAVVWSQGEGFPDVLLRLAEEMKSRRAYPGDSVFDATSLLSDLVATISLGIEQRERERGDMHAFGHIVERLNDDWILTEEGMEHVSKPPYCITPEQLLDDEFFHEHMLQKRWVAARADNFEDAWDLARSYHQKKRRQTHRLIAREGE